MNVNPLVLHRVGTLMVLLLIGLTAILFIAGSDYSWLGMGATGLALLAWASSTWSSAPDGARSWQRSGSPSHCSVCFPGSICSAPTQPDRRPLLG